MWNKSRMVRAAAALATLTAASLAAIPAHAVVYCKTVGVPQGCVARPGPVVVAPAPVVVAPAPVVVAPVARPVVRRAVVR
jgi:hypothetical protein